MTTATASKTASAELAELEKRVAKARAKAHEARDDKDAWEREVPELRARVDALEPESAEARKLVAGIMARETSRIHNTGPKAEAYQAAVEPFHALDAELQRFKRANIRQRIAEVDPDSAAEQFSEAFTAILAAADRYRDVLSRVRVIVNDTPGFDGQDYGYDGRVEDWARFAADALDGEITPPCLSPMGSWKADNHE